MKRILIIGGTGTISWPITKKLAENPDNQVYVFNRGNKNALLPEGITFIKGDITDTKAMAQLFAGYSFDCVINFIIWNAKDAADNIALFTGKTKQFVFISTVAVLDHETTCLINEESPIGNRYSPYGQNKAAAEACFLTAYETDGFPVTIIRPTQTYAKDRIPLSIKGSNCWGVVQRMIEGKEVIIHGEGQSIWASTHAEDFAEGFVPIIEQRALIGSVCQIMNPATHTWDMLYQTLADLLGVAFRPVYIPTDLLRHGTTYDFEQSIQGDKRWSNLFDISRLKTIVPDFEPQISLEEGLRRYLAYMADHPELKQADAHFDQWCDQVINEYRNVQKDFLAKLSKIEAKES
ncbi:NAD-dependent epimerase/dehydratase family protein [Enterococcus sp.]|uniref:NAD-dependent epimerase/dehydratase family protein n=1 Tax=Enterococcus sp. TaxID=35783 RepID=UPI0028AEB630|nr:NAD-dependent epimerase/dehydratase family protein [Enterococcus sp.]